MHPWCISRNEATMTSLSVLRGSLWRWVGVSRAAGSQQGSSCSSQSDAWTHSFVHPFVTSSAPICIWNLSFPHHSWCLMLSLALALLTGTSLLQSICLCHYLFTDNSLRKHHLATITLKTLHNGPYRIAKITFFLTIT